MVRNRGKRADLGCAGQPRDGEVYAVDSSSPPKQARLRSLGRVLFQEGLQGVDAFAAEGGGHVVARARRGIACWP